MILAYYKGQLFIDEQISSILNQINVSIDIFIFDDKSNDTYIDKFDNYMSKIKIIKYTENTGSAANNFCISLMNLTNDQVNEYDYFCFADQDDIWLPNKIDKGIKCLNLFKSELYFSDLYIYNNNKKSNIKYLKKSYPQKKYDYLFESASAGCTSLYSREFAKNFIIFLRNFDFLSWNKQKNNKPYFSHDWLIYFYARLNNFPVYIDQNAYILYRIHENNVHGTLNLNNLSSFFNKLKLVTNGWYFNQTCNFIKLIDSNSQEYQILFLYNKNWFTRIFVLIKYNFHLIRDKKKFFNFFIISIIPRFYKL